MQRSRMRHRMIVALAACLMAAGSAGAADRRVEESFYR